MKSIKGYVISVLINCFCAGLSLVVTTWVFLVGVLLVERLVVLALSSRLVEFLWCVSNDSGVCRTIVTPTRTHYGRGAGRQLANASFFIAHVLCVAISVFFCK